MTSLREFIGYNLKLIKTTKNGNVFSDSKHRICLLKPVNREFTGVKKKPVFYIQSLDQGKATYLSGLFETNEHLVYSGDYKDALGFKHLVHVSFSPDAKTIKIEEHHARK